jgi:hypothetical protein
MIFDTVPLETARTFDENGYLHVSTSNITKEQVVPYIGNTIPGWQDLGLKPKAIYQIYRPAEEIEKAVDTFNGLPLSLDHWEMDASNMPKDKIVGSLGTDAAFDAPYLTNSLTVTDADAIERIKSGEFRDLSAGYLCDVVMESGIFDGKSYDGRMKNIRGNHVALVREGRAGHDVRVADSAMEGGENMGNAWKTLFFELTEALKNGGDTVEEIKKEEIMKEDSAPDMTNTSPAVENAPEVATETKDEEPVDVLADELREAMKAAGLDPEDKAAQKAFIAGMAYREANDAKEEAPAEDACKAKDEETADACAKDSAPVFDKAMAAALYAAAEEVAPYVGKISNPFAFDSAADIYKKALDAKGVEVAGVDPSAFGAMVKMLTKAAPIMDAAPVEEDPMNDILRGIKSR